MTKKVFTYLLAFLLLATVVAPSYYAVVENECEIEQYEPLEEEGNEKSSTEDFKEFKMYQTIILTSFYNVLVRKKQPVFEAKFHASNFLNLDTPPPEFVA